MDNSKVDSPVWVLQWDTLDKSAGLFGATFADGVFWVSLAAISDPELIPASIALALGLRFEAAAEPAAQLVSYLRDKEMLLVLDNFEQLQPNGAGADLLLTILQRAPRHKHHRYLPRTPRSASGSFVRSGWSAAAARM